MKTPLPPHALHRSALLVFGAALLVTTALHADGKLFPPRDYAGSIEERAQEAIITFHAGEKLGEAREDLILKVSVEAQAPARSFGWVVPFPSEPKTAPEDAVLFKEAFDYVEARLAARRRAPSPPAKDAAPAAGAASDRVEVLSRKVVGSYDVAVVREKAAGALNEWLQKEGFQPVPDGEETIEHYRRKGYVFACMRVSDAEVSKDAPVDLHPLRFSFATGGRDGIYFPMKLSALQEKPFDLNLYVFFDKWLNDHRSAYGYEHRGLRLKYRDWDTPECKPDAGKSWSAPDRDPFLAPLAHRVPSLAKLFQKLHPGARYYLTNLHARGLKPRDLREWKDDLWLFPYYIDPDFVPFDARDGGPAAGAYE
jgi:hypothetical protein